MIATNRRAGVVLAATLVLVSTASCVLPARAQEPAPAARFALAAAADTILAPVSGLPYPRGAEQWADARFRPTPGADGKVTGAFARIREFRAVVFQPQGAAPTVAALAEFCAARGVLAPGRPEHVQAETTPDAAGNVRSWAVYRGATAGDLAALGVTRNARSGNTLASVIILSGDVSAREAAGLARGIGDDLAEEARKRRLRLAPPVPVGMAPARPTYRVEGPALKELLQGIERSIHVTPAVRDMARALIPQAQAVTVSTWRSQAVLPDAALVQYYLTTAKRLGWSVVSIDQTQPGRPTLVFQLPAGEGVILVRAAPSTTETLGVIGRPYTAVYVLVMDGRINVSGLGKN